jgi:hypothetical protein
MSAEYRQGSSLDGVPLNQLQDWYSELSDQLDAARRRKDRMETVQLMAERELLRVVIDGRVDDLLAGNAPRRLSRPEL